MSLRPPSSPVAVAVVCYFFYLSIDRYVRVFVCIFFLFLFFADKYRTFFPTKKKYFYTKYKKVLDDVEPARRPARDNDGSDEGDARTAYLQPSLKAEPFARPELERDHQANIDFERYRGRV